MSPSLVSEKLEVLTKDTTWEPVMGKCDPYWLSADNEDTITSNFYFDIVTETCPAQASRVTSCVPRQAPGARLMLGRMMLRKIVWQEFSSASNAAQSPGNSGCSKIPPDTPLRRK